MRLAIDLGHGQDNRTIGVFDPGACADGLREYDLIRDYGYEVADRMRTAGADVLMIDSGYVAARDNRAAAWGATHYLAIHFDSFGATASGTGVFINRGDPYGVGDEAAMLGQAVADALRLGWRGVREKDFYVLGGRQPDMLLETCFMSNRSDVLLYREHRAAVVDAVVGFLCDWGGLEAKDLKMDCAWLIVPGSEANRVVARTNANGRGLWAEEVTKGFLWIHARQGKKAESMKDWLEGRKFKDVTTMPTYVGSFEDIQTFFE